ncbi:MAG: four helix bundle protein [bacterium]
MIKGYEKLDVWKLTHALALEIFRTSEQFPRREQFGITMQLRRAAVSIPTNLAEGSARHYHQEFLHFCGIARGSMAEVHYLLRFILDLGWFSTETYEKYSVEYDHAGRMLNSLITYLRRQSSRRRA